jgi:tetratricopeptide (TPR) repeat protein
LHVVELDPKAAPAWGLLGLCEFDTGKYEQSLTHIQRSLFLGLPNQPQMAHVLRYHEAMLLTRAGEFDRAIQLYSQLVRSGAQDPSMLTSIGLAALRTPLLPKDVLADRQNLFLTAGKASFYTMAGDVQKAQRTYEEMLQQFPAIPNSHYPYACFLLSTDVAGAVGELKREMEVAPSNAAAAAMLAWVLFREGDYRTALPYADKAARVAPKLVLAQAVFGRLLVETGAVNEGIEHLKAAESLDPAFLEAHLSLATAYSRIGRMQDARRERQISLDIGKEQDRVAGQ